MPLDGRIDVMAPPQRHHPETGARLVRGTRPATLRHRGRQTIVDLPGWYPDEGGDGIVDADDMRCLDRALDALKTAVDLDPRRA
jgi:HTH-type transcriptional regulator/antitoxin MqsA